jgi:acetyl esterase/lipase
MRSRQSHLLAFGLKRLKIFGGEEIDPIRVRRRIERLASLARPPRRVRVVPVVVDAVPAEWLIPPAAPKDRALLYIHGGAWFMGSTNTHRLFVSHLAYASGVRALSIDYRLAPEHPFPAGLDDCVAAYEWLLRGGIAPEKIVVAGDSAGGNLTLALLIALRDAGRPLPAGAVAISPATDLTFTGESYTARAHLDPILSHLGPDTSSMLKGYITDHDPRHPLISPLYADLRGLPPLLLHAGDHEVLLDGVVGFGERAVAAGVAAQTVVWPGMFHVFQVFAPVLPEARQANAQIAAFIRSRLDDGSQGPALVGGVGDELVQGSEARVQQI